MRKTNCMHGAAQSYSGQSQKGNATHINKIIISSHSARRVCANALRLRLNTKIPEIVGQNAIVFLIV